MVSTKTTRQQGATDKESQKEQKGMKGKALLAKVIRVPEGSFLTVMQYNLKQRGVTYKIINTSGSPCLFDGHSGR